MKKPSQARWNRCVSHAGFTLIELLTVIAIIAILAGLTAVAVPQYLNKAQEVKTKANMSNVRQAISVKATEAENRHGFPPAYGYVRNPAPGAADWPSPVPDEAYVLRPYTAEVGIHGAEDVYQVGWYATQGHDLDMSGPPLALFEYQPVGEKNAATGAYVWSDTLYDGTMASMPMTPGGVNEVQQQLSTETAPPYVYVPFNKRQLAAVTRYWLRDDGSGGYADVYGEQLDSTADELAGRLFFPPPQYDGFVLVGNGPGGTDGGVASGPPPAAVGGGYDADYLYHIMGLRIAFLATRDLDDNGPDFDYETRKAGGAGYALPDRTNGQGAFIVVVD